MSNPNPAQAPAKANPIYDLLKKNMAAISSVLPKQVDPKRQLRLAFHIINGDANLRACSQNSLISAVLEASQMGLEIGGPLGHAHILPFKGKAQLVVGFRGYLDLAYRSGRVESFFGAAVHEKDRFDYRYGLHEKLEHVPAAGAADPGKLIFAYAVVRFRGGGHDFEVITERDAMKAMQSSPGSGKDTNPWRTHPGPMWVKTAFRKLAKRLPQSPELQRAAILEDEAERGEQSLFDTIDLEPVPEAAQTKTGEVLDTLRNKALKPAPAPTQGEESQDQGEGDGHGQDDAQTTEGEPVSLKDLRNQAMLEWQNSGRQPEHAEKFLKKSIAQWTRKDCAQISEKAATPYDPRTGD